MILIEGLRNGTVRAVPVKKKHGWEWGLGGGGGAGVVGRWHLIYFFIGSGQGYRKPIFCRFRPIFSL